MPSQSIPTLITERLTLRAPVTGDFPAYARLLASPRAKGIGGPYAQRAAGGSSAMESRAGTCSGMGR